ncbi:MAG: class II aldolase/adducin family protein, partial [Solirubrobacteraceae bacterium]
MPATVNIDHLRAEVADAGRTLAAAGLVAGVAGNVSARAGDLIAVTPTGARLARLSPEQIAVVDRNGTLVDGTLAPTSELALHLAIYRRFDAAAVVHTHPPMATAVACVADELPCIHYALLALGGDVRVARYATFGSAALATSVVEALDGRRAALMASHGAVAFGDDLQGAIDATELLEWGCTVYVNAHACGAPRVLGEDERLAVVEALRSYGYGATRSVAPPVAQLDATVATNGAEPAQDGRPLRDADSRPALDWAQRLTLHAVQRGDSDDTVARDALIEAGLVEQRADGSYAVTAAGQAALDADE